MTEIKAVNKEIINVIPIDLNEKGIDKNGIVYHELYRCICPYCNEENITFIARYIFEDDDEYLVDEIFTEGCEHFSSITYNDSDNSVSYIFEVYNE